MSHTVYLTREYHGSPPPPGCQIPSPAELVEICPRNYPGGYNRGLAYPPESPVFWIKHGRNIIWNELEAQSVAHRELRGLQSPVQAPAIFYACELKAPNNFKGKISYGYRGYIVMEYIPGKTAEEWIEDAQEPEQQDFVYSRLALALSELLRIPVPQGQPPTAIDNGRIWHCFFDEQYAPVHYKSVQDLEDHINQWIPMVRKKPPHRVQDLTLEPMVYCYSDLWLRNFIIDQDNTISVVDFSEVSYLPCSFFKLALVNQTDKLQRDITPLVTLPPTSSIDNTTALAIASGAIVMSSYSFANLGYRLFGRPPQENTDREERLLKNSEGKPVLATYTAEREVSEQPEVLNESDSSSEC